MVPSESKRPSEKGDAGGNVRSIGGAPVNISGVATPAKNKAKENTPTSQVSLNSTARSPKTLLVQRKAMSVRDTFIEDKDDFRKYVKASKCSTMIPF